MDKTDQKILEILQQDATIAVADLAKKVGLSTTPCWRRVQKLEEDKVIQRRVAILDGQKINAGVSVFVSVKTAKHNKDWLDHFSKKIASYAEVIEFYRMSGEVDYLLKVVVPDIAAYDAFYQKMVADIDIEDVSSAFAMEKIKSTTAMPLDYIKLTRLAKEEG